MKIVRIIARLNIGGPARNAVILSGARETVLVCGEPGAGEGDMMYLAREKGIRPVVVPELGRELSFWDDWKAFWKIYKIIRKERPDIVHTHTAKAGALGRLAGILCGCKLVHTFHGHVFRGYFGWVKSLVFLWAEKILALFTDRIITVSEALKKELVEEYRVAPQKKVQVIELGFELEELLDLPVKEAGAVVNIGIVGRLVPIKNHRMLLKIASAVSRPRNDNKIKLIVIGDGELKKDLERYAEELGIKDKVEFRGWVKDLKEIYSELDIVTLTSLNEGTPVSIIEAMAAARPIVATDVGGVRDIIEDGKSGYLVVSGDEEKFAEKLLDLIKYPEKRKRFGQYGRGSVKDRFSKDRLIKDTEELYREVFYNL
jgi:glycosyltransferase involved in cell wall biosynthesis